MKLWIRDGEKVLKRGRIYGICIKLNMGNIRIRGEEVLFFNFFLVDKVIIFVSCLR